MCVCVCVCSGGGGAYMQVVSEWVSDVPRFEFLTAVSMHIVFWEVKPHILVEIYQHVGWICFLLQAHIQKDNFIFLFLWTDWCKLFFIY